MTNALTTLKRSALPDSDLPVPAFPALSINPEKCKFDNGIAWKLRAVCKTPRLFGPEITGRAATNQSRKLPRPSFALDVQRGAIPGAPNAILFTPVLMVGLCRRSPRT